MKIETVKTDAFTMDYCRLGHGKATLVILPGVSVQRVMASAGAIGQAYAPMEDDFTVYVFERRNDMPSAYAIRDMARDTAAAIKALGLGPVNLFGASQGGMIAMEIAIEYPELVRGMVLGSTSAYVTEEQYHRVFERWADLAKNGNAATLYLAFGEAVYPADVFEGSRELLVEAARTVTDEDLSRFVIQTESMKGFDVRPELARITCPVLAIGDAADRVFGGEASAQIAEHLRHGEFHIYDGYGHAVYDLAPDYKQRVRRFLTGQATHEG